MLPNANRSRLQESRVRGIEKARSTQKKNIKKRLETRKRIEGAGDGGNRAYFTRREKRLSGEEKRQPDLRFRSQTTWLLISPFFPSDVKPSSNKYAECGTFRKQKPLLQISELK